MDEAPDWLDASGVEVVLLLGMLLVEPAVPDVDPVEDCEPVVWPFMLGSDVELLGDVVLLGVEVEVLLPIEPVLLEDPVWVLGVPEVVLLCAPVVSGVAVEPVVEELSCVPVVDVVPVVLLVPVVLPVELWFGVWVI